MKKILLVALLSLAVPPTLSSQTLSKSLIVEDAAPLKVRPDSILLFICHAREDSIKIYVNGILVASNLFSTDAVYCVIATNKYNRLKRSAKLRIGIEYTSENKRHEFVVKNYFTHFYISHNLLYEEFTIACDNKSSHFEVEPLRWETL
ncbi:MAG: hypothetical protein RL660_397 [Bacteroidota bacterium]|jgi:hypothetical protein